MAAPATTCLSSSPSIKPPPSRPEQALATPLHSLSPALLIRFSKSEGEHTKKKFGHHARAPASSGKLGGGDPASSSTSPGRGPPPQDHPRRRPPSRRLPWPSLASSCRPVRGTEEEDLMWSIPCSSLYFFSVFGSVRIVFLGPAQQSSSSQPSLGLPVASQAQQHAGTHAAQQRPVLFFFRRTFFFSC